MRSGNVEGCCNTDPLSILPRHALCAFLNDLLRRARCTCVSFYVTEQLILVRFHTRVDREMEKEASFRKQLSDGAIRRNNLGAAAMAAES